MSSREHAALLVVGVVLVTGCGPSSGSDAAGIDSQLPNSISFSMRIFDCATDANLPNVPIDIRALSTPAVSVASGTSDAAGIVDFDLVPPAGRFFLHGVLPGYREAHFFPDNFIQMDPGVLQPGTMCLTPQALWDQFFMDTGLTSTPGTGVVVVKLLDPALGRLSGTVSISPPGEAVIYGVAPDEAWDPAATMTDFGIAYVPNVPGGPISVTATTATETLTLDAWSFDGALVGVSFRFGL